MEGRYEELLRKSQLVGGPDPRDKQVGEALSSLDLDGATRLLQQLLKEQEITEKVFSARYFRAAQMSCCASDARLHRRIWKRCMGCSRMIPGWHFPLVHEGLFARYRALAQENPVACRPDVALIR